MQQILEKQFFLQRLRSWYYIQTKAAEFRYFKTITINFSCFQTDKTDIIFQYQKSLTYSFVFVWKKMSVLTVRKYLKLIVIVSKYLKSAAHIQDFRPYGHKKITPSAISPLFI